jgi:hypothetical protein
MRRIASCYSSMNCSPRPLCRSSYHAAPSTSSSSAAATTRTFTQAAFPAAAGALGPAKTATHPPPSARLHTPRPAPRFPPARLPRLLLVPRAALSSPANRARAAPDPQLADVAPGRELVRQSSCHNYSPLAIFCSIPNPIAPRPAEWHGHPARADRISLRSLI